jgi:hypothetical protein
MIKNKKERKTMIDKDKLIQHIINWLNGNIDNYEVSKDSWCNLALAEDSADLKEKIDLYLEGVDEF